MYGYWAGRRTPRSALGFSLDEIVNLGDIQEAIRRNTVKAPGPDACWMWRGPVQAYRKRNGDWGARMLLFTVFERGYMRVGVARLVYVLQHGLVENKRRVRHTCEEPLCARPDHIVLATPSKAWWGRKKPQRAQQERAEHQRTLAERAVAGVDADTVEQIRFYAWMGEDQKSLARHFGVEGRVVARILAQRPDAGAEAGAEAGARADAAAHTAV